MKFKVGDLLHWPREVEDWGIDRIISISDDEYCLELVRGKFNRIGERLWWKFDYVHTNAELYINKESNFDKLYLTLKQ